MKTFILFLSVIFLSTNFLCADIIPEYPKRLTSKDWKKKKGLLAKIFKKKTGMTKRLKDAEKLYKKITDDLVAFDGSTLKGLDAINMTLINNKIGEISNKVNTLVDPFVDEIEEVEKLAKKLETEWKKTKKVTKKSRKHVGKMAEDAKKFIKKLKKIEDKAEESYKKAKNNAIDQLAIIPTVAIKNIREGYKDMRDNPTISQFNEYFQKYRAVQTFFQQVPNATISNKWNKFTASNSGGISGEDREVPGFMEEVLDLCEETEDFIKSLKD